MRALNIAYGNSRAAKFWSNKTIKFEELCDRLRTPVYTSETAEEYPKLPKGQRDDIKDKGGFVAGHLSGNRRQANKVVCRSMLVYDLDSIEPEFLEDISSKIHNMGCYYTTHSHMPEKPRARMIIPVSRDMTADEFNAAARYYAQDNDFITMLDPCSFSPHQLMYWPTCPSNGEYLFDTFDGDWLDPDEVFAKHPNWRDCSLLPTTPKESKAADRKVQQQKDPLEKEGVVGLIDMIITKSISRFARNTLDCLNYVRELKDLGIGIIFEKENINTLDAKGEVLLTILSSLAQDESRSMSENSTWGIRRRFEKGQHKMSTKRFLGYDTDEDGKLVINRKQAVIVKRLYFEFLSGKTVDYIKQIFEREGAVNWDGSTKWQATTLQSMLENEKYMGDAILQKSYTVDFLTKKRVMNQGEIQKFYIEDDHEAIIEPWIWACVQLEIKRRKRYLEEHGTKSYSNNTEKNPFASKIICGECNKVFTRKGWHSSTGETRKVWQCSERYKVKGIMGCANRHVEESTLEKAFVMAWNGVLENKEYFLRKWKEQAMSEDLLEVYRAKDFQELIKMNMLAVRIESDFMLRILDYIKVFENGQLLVMFLDGTGIECS